MMQESHSLFRKIIVRKLLQNLRLYNIVCNNKFALSEVFQGQREATKNVARQGPIKHRSMQDKVEYLYMVFIGLS